MNTVAVSAQALQHWLPQDQAELLHQVQQGVPGKMVRLAVSKMPRQRASIVRALDTSSANLSRLYARKALNRRQSEEILDILQVYQAACEVFDTEIVAQEWLETPVAALNDTPANLLDSFTGRTMVKAALAAIRYGEFA